MLLKFLRRPGIGAFYAFRADVDPFHAKTFPGEFDREVPFPTPDLEHITSQRCDAVDKILPLRSEEQVKKKRVIPQLRVVAAAADISPKTGLLLRQAAVTCRRYRIVVHSSNSPIFPNFSIRFSTS